MIHTTIGLYADGSFKMNGVLPQDLKGHVEYNKKYRVGRTFFVDGELIHKGYHNDEQVKAFQERIERENLKAVRCTSPYQ